MMKITNYEWRITNYGLAFFTFLIFNFALTQAAPAQVSSGGSFGLEKSVIPAGGGESAAGGLRVAGTAGQNAAGTSTQNGNFFQVGGFWTADRLAPTAASVSISGRVITSKGKGIRNVIVTLTDSAGVVRMILTGSFGFYRFTDVEVGHAYILKVQAKKYVFADPVRVMVVNDELTDIDFTAEE